MMPTSPSPPLKFRTVGFPQYGYKASLSVGAFHRGSELKSTPDIRSTPRCCSQTFARFHALAASWALSPTRSTLRRAAVRTAIAALPQGSLAPVRVLLSRSIIAYYDPIRQSRRHATISRLAAYTPRLRCAGAPRRPTRPSLLSLPCCPHVPSTIRRWVRDAVPLLVRAAIPGFLGCKTSRHPRDPSLPAIPDGKSFSTLHRSLHATARVFASPS